MSIQQYTFVRLCLSVNSVLLFDHWVTGVEQAEPRSAISISHSTDCDPGLLEHLVQRGLLNGRWRDTLLVCQELQLPGRGREAINCTVQNVDCVYVSYIHTLQFYQLTATVLHMLISDTRLEPLGTNRVNVQA